MKAARAAAAAALGLLACSICCCCNGLLGLLQVTALSHSSIPQFQAWLHPLSPLSPPPPVFLPEPFAFPPLPSLFILTFSTQKIPKCPLCCLVGSKTPLWQWVAHFTWQPGSCWSTTKVRTFSFPPVPVRQSNWPAPVGDSGRASSGSGRARHSPRLDPLLKLSPPSAL